jgi:hypothetical protein
MHKRKMRRLNAIVHFCLILLKTIIIPSMFGNGNVRKLAPYGAWKSPITSELIVAGSIGLMGLGIDGEAIYWLESRPSESGRSALVKWTPDGGRKR